MKIPYTAKTAYYTGNLDAFAPILKREFDIPHTIANTKFQGYILDNRKFIKDRKIKINYYRLRRWAQALNYLNKWYTINRLFEAATYEIQKHLPRLIPPIYRGNPSKNRAYINN